MTKPAMPRLYHVSESPDIEVFEPRSAPPTSTRADEPVVWTIAETMLHNYLLPRGCPRVGFYALASSTAEDKALFGLTTASFVLAIEAAWFRRASEIPLYLYELPAEKFELYDDVAGYYVSSARLEPIGMTTIERPLEALLQRNVELRVLPSLWQLRDAVVNSSLGFSCIRMRHARPRDS